MRAVGILGNDNNQYIVIEASDWVDLAGDVSLDPGQLRKPARRKVIDFLKWFAAKGLYAEAYAALKGQYTQADSINLSTWLNSRLGGIPVRNQYTNFLTQQGCYKWHEYANWTNYVYKGLFGMTAKQMNEQWDLIDGDKSIARNRIPEASGLKARGSLLASRSHFVRSK
ncbi:hypothetical protein Sta7437_1504 [Stanieria cyanosphaera PCC 7437]|uniref:Uncharacterized protein n=1 Tax=Stanieria cyanosphaera (strain ATCC 29371 / PCC 7437) TaxID=111780 RepID=K9XSN4_STAC7|nr:hypothetical protein [Stanieria cyanosphaera]AFZ35071.1 hypothetical protein Sta7437_1504 [Stanieria cyanosphaera PCC 7437]